MSHDQLPAEYEWFPQYVGALSWGHYEALKIADDYFVDDIKEKYGELRVYLSTPLIQEGEEAWEIVEGLRDLADAIEQRANGG